MFDRFDVCEAYWCYAVDYYSGQGSSAYALHSVFLRLGFKPRPNLSRRTLSENARAIYDALASGQRNIRDRC